jgi:hypothetical protein
MSKKKRKQDWIKITTPENKEMIASPEYIKKLLDISGIDKTSFYNHSRRISYLENRIVFLESPMRREKIIKLLERDGEPHTIRWIEGRISGFRYYDLDYLLENNLIIESKSGTHTLYGLPEEVL